jgi:IPTL-CTERM motif
LQSTKTGKILVQKTGGRHVYQAFSIFFRPFRHFFQGLTLLVLMASASVSVAKTITFEALVCGGGLLIRNGYEGLNWTNFYCIDATTSGVNPSGYPNGRVSGNNVAFNGSGNPATFAFTAPVGGRFRLVSMNLTGAWNNNLQVRIQTFRGGVPVTDTTSTVQTTGPTLVVVNANDIDSVTMTGSGGGNAGFGGNGTHFVMDDLVIADAEYPVTSVPTLSDWALLLLCGLMFAAAYRNRKTLG